MAPISRILSSATSKPYRTKALELDNPPYLNDDGFVAFKPGDVENPQNWSTTRRWVVTMSAVLLVMNATWASSSPSGCFPSISEHFHVSMEVAGLTVTLFLLGYCAGPLVFAPLSEFYGRRYIFYITFLLYLVFNFLCAFAPNFGSLLVGRFLTGTFVSAPLSNAPGVLVDLWSPLERGNAMAGFSAMVWIGPALGPVVSGFMQLTKDWRWSFYILLWLGGASALIMFTIPETHGPTILVTKARRIRKAKIPGFENVQAPVEAQDRTLAGIYKVALTRPWIILFDTISFLCAIYMSVVYTLLYMLFTIYPIVFQERRGWNAGVGQLPLVGTVLGALLGAVIVMFDSRKWKKRFAKGETTFEPEDRLPLAMMGGVGFAVTMFWFAWSSQYDSIHWIVPTLAGCFLSTALMLIFVGFLSYLTDTYTMYAASAIAANTIARSACGAAAPLFTHRMFEALGVGGGGSLIGGVATVLAIIPFTFYKYGKAIRVRSKFAPTAQRTAEKERDEEAGPAELALQQPMSSGSSSTIATSRLEGDISGEDDVVEEDEEKKKEEQ